MPQLVLVSVSTHEGIDGHYISYLIPTPTIPHAAEVAKAILLGRDTYDVGALSREMTSVLPSYRLILPLATAHISAGEWDTFGQRALASIPRQHMPIVLGWVSSEATRSEWASVQQMLPRPVRILAQAFWVPAYAKHRRRLYHQAGKLPGPKSLYRLVVGVEPSRRMSVWK